jgi:citrate lyase subunit beta/citryl-CoA lyase
VTFPRSLLFVPANRTEMFARAWASSADAVVLDLEDSVPPEQKPAAREALASLKPPPEWSGPILARLNACRSPDFDLDVKAAVAAPLWGVVLPKTERAEEVRATDAALGTRGRPDRALALVLLIETPAGILRALELTQCDVSRVAALAFGAEDYRAAMGVNASDSGVLLDFARAMLANAAAAAGLPAIDAPELDVRDVDRLREATRRARALGFRAKFAIHPSQLPVIHEVFTVPDDRAWAARVLEAYERAVADGRGSVALDGRMIDAATIRRAKEILGLKTED